MYRFIAPRTAWRCVAVGSFIALLALPLAAQAATGDRIFEDGFDPCCSIGGTVSGLSGSGLVLHLHAGSIDEDKPIAANGLYRFAASVPTGTTYSLTVGTQPAGQTCSFTISGGNMGTSNIDNADLTCSGNLQWDSGTWGQDWN
ncbi:MAG: hypothetical protein WCD66_05540 [Rhodanobacteraceae bacterium]